ncbi:hypothetical protein [Cronobacter dublinensis]|uniref:hypothetical protein n=1 Tax=Cronobacter dublinensis TaxID=413497 RepID=UPI0024AE022F|nr:hypothetical protein [Cronobacter dublinensis]EGT4357449.1 hypothetical protein [Cronobacter dublinensis]MDI6478136.1 hypothetical protein [Cronobacter dublinensis]
MILNINLSFLLKQFFFLGLLCFSHFLSASTMNAIFQNTEVSEWSYFFILKPFNQNKISYDNMLKFFNEKKITFNSGRFSVGDVCSYKYHAQFYSPVTFWGGAKTVEYYQSLFSNYKITIPDKLLSIKPVNPLENCEFPFSEFIVLDDALAFFYENNVIFYFKNRQDLIAHQNQKNDHNNIDDNRSKICMTGKINDNSYERSVDCFYKNKDIISAYKVYREGLDSNNKRILLEVILENQNNIMKYDDDSVEVSYEWIGRDELHIRQRYDGGEILLHFVKGKGGTKVTKEISPD